MDSASVATIKEVGRLVIFAAIGAGLTALIGIVAEVPTTTSTAIISLILRAVDKYIHKADVQANGLLPF